MKLIDLNREGGIGANCQLLLIGSFNILVDAGMHPKKVGVESLPDISRMAGVKLDFVLLTHCHLDHLGALPVVLRNQPDAQVLMSIPSISIAERMLRNSCNVMRRQREELNLPELPLFTHREVDRIVPQFFPMTYNRTSTFDKNGEELSVTFFPAGHIAGAGGIELVHGRQKIFLTGDVLFAPQKILPGAKFPSRHVDTLIVETTRGQSERLEFQTRASEIERLITKVREVIERGGSCLIPVFALGRMQEILTILHEARRHDKIPRCPVFCSGLGIDLVDYFDEIARKTGLVQFRRQVVDELDAQPLPKNLQPGRDLQRNAIYVLSSGMLVENTPSYRVAACLVGHPRNAICYVGYCDPETPGGKMLETQAGDDFIFEALDFTTPIKADIERFELSGHADREELLEFILAVNPRVVVLTHGDPPARAWFAETLKTIAPAMRVIDPVPLKEETL